MILRTERFAHCATFSTPQTIYSLLRTLPARKAVLRSEADGGESRQEQVVVGASAEDAEAAERSPLQLPESLIPEQVSIGVIHKSFRPSLVLI